MISSTAFSTFWRLAASLGGIVEGVRYRVGLQEVQDARLVVVRQRNVEIAACEDQIQHLRGVCVARVPVGQCVIVVRRQDRVVREHLERLRDQPRAREILRRFRNGQRVRVVVLERAVVLILRFVQLRHRDDPEVGLHIRPRSG